MADSDDECSFHSCEMLDMEEGNADMSIDQSSEVDSPSPMRSPAGLKGDSTSPLPQAKVTVRKRAGARRLVLSDDEEEAETCEDTRKGETGSTSDSHASTERPMMVAVDVDGAKYEFDFTPCDEDKDDSFADDGTSSVPIQDQGKPDMTIESKPDNEITKSSRKEAMSMYFDEEAEESSAQESSSSQDERDESEDESFADENDLSNQVTLTWAREKNRWVISAAGSNSQYSLAGDVGDKLYDYQRIGVEFILRIWASPMAGGVLADDMGMGKTNQAIAALSALFISDLARNALIIAPLAVLDKWRAIASAQLGSTANVSVYHGSAKDRIWASFKSRGERGVLLTTYETCQTNSTAFSQVKWDALIADEASKIKNFKSGLFKNLRPIAESSKRRLCITGTPFENNLSELWAIFDFACSGKLFGAHDRFLRLFAGKIEGNQLRGLSGREKAVGTKLTHALGKAIQPYILRREKSLLYEKRAEPNESKDADQQKVGQVTQVTEKEPSQVTTDQPLRPQFDSRKVDLLVWVQLSQAQRAKYKLFLESKEVALALNQTRSPLAALTVLKKICDDLRLVEPMTAFFPSSGEKSTSSKLEVLMGLLQDVAVDAGHKVLVFSHSKMVLTFIEQALKAKFRRTISYLRVDGDMKVEDRTARIRAFNKDEALTNDDQDDFEGRWDVLLMTSGVGALGIEVTGADRVVIFDPHWNPAVDDQAIDRAFRIGQKRNVICFRFVTVGTVEEKMTRIQLRKSATARAILNLEAHEAYSTKDDLKNLFSLSEPDAPDLLLKAITSTLGSGTVEKSAMRALGESGSERDRAEVLTQIRALMGEADEDCGLQATSLVNAGLVSGVTDRIALFSKEDGTVQQLEQTLQSLTLNSEEREEANKAVEHALGWLSARKKHSKKAQS